MINEVFDLDSEGVWDTEKAFQQLLQLGKADTKRTAERRLHELKFLPKELSFINLKDDLGHPPLFSVLEWEMEKARRKRILVLFVQLSTLATGKLCLHANDARGARYWIPYMGSLENAIIELQAYFNKNLLLIPHGNIISKLREIRPVERVSIPLLAYLLPIKIRNEGIKKKVANPHLDKLEAESIHIIREAIAEAENPAMLYSIGKDSSVMLHLARKAFFPSPPPFPLLHVDTRWKFQEMYQFRDFIAQESKMDLLVHINPIAIEKNINPFDHGSALHTDITKTEGLKQALDKYKFDVVFGGARRDEEKSRAKERVFSFRTQSHAWDPKNQRPELWNLYNTKKNKGESIRVFPLSNWTELDVWQYIEQEQIPVVPLYFSQKRPAVIRNGLILLIDDNRMKFLPEEEIQYLQIRFRTLGCYPLTGAIESTATNVKEIIQELINSRISERQGRAIDTDSSASMEKKKKEGYF
jgi:sulfate adenylyltransferase subunit 2